MQEDARLRKHGRERIRREVVEMRIMAPGISGDALRGTSTHFMGTQPFRRFGGCFQIHRIGRSEGVP